MVNDPGFAVGSREFDVDGFPFCSIRKIEYSISSGISKLIRIGLWHCVLQEDESTVAM